MNSELGPIIRAVGDGSYKVSLSSRRGNVVVLTAVMMVALMAIVGFSIDIGYLCVVRSELQRTADSAALAGASMLYTPIDSVEFLEYRAPFQIDEARNEARTYGVVNGAGRYTESRSGKTLDLNLNSENSPTGDIVVGRLSNTQWTVSEIAPNSVKVHVRLTEKHQNGPVALFLGSLLGAESASASAVARATVESFPTLLPITTYLPHFESGDATDEYSFDDGQVRADGDGIPEVAIYPGPWNGESLPPGNFGALEIGPSSGTTVLRQQIDHGPSRVDFDYHGGSLYQGMEISGQTGIKADIDTAFKGGRADGTTYDGVVGEVRIMPLYEHAAGNGTNATFTIVKFVAVRIMYADLKSGNKRVVVQRIDDTKDLKAMVHLSL